MFCGWTRAHRSDADGLGAAAAGGERTAGGSDRSCWGDGDPGGEAGPPVWSAGSTSVTGLLPADLLPCTCSLSGLSGQLSPCPHQGLPPPAPSPLNYFRGGIEGRRRGIFSRWVFPVALGLPGVGSFLVYVHHRVCCVFNKY